MSAIRYPWVATAGPVKSLRLTSWMGVSSRIKDAANILWRGNSYCYLTFRLLVDPVATTLWLALLCLQGALSGLGHSLIHADMETRRTIERGHNWTEKS